MASLGIQAWENLEDDIHGHDGTIEDAMKIWNAQIGPCVYNDWQSCYFQLRRPQYQLTDEGVPEGEDRKAQQVRLKEMYDRVQTELHGDDHVEQARIMLAAKRKAARSADALRAPTRTRTVAPLRSRRVAVIPPPFRPGEPPVRLCRMMMMTG